MPKGQSEGERINVGNKVSGAARNKDKGESGEERIKDGNKVSGAARNKVRGESEKRIKMGIKRVEEQETKLRESQGRRESKLRIKQGE